MSELALHPSTRIVEAEWLRPRLRPFGSVVASVVPDGFPAYVRILHPVRGPNEEPLRWADVAAQTGSTMHRLVQFENINRPLLSTTPETSPWLGDDPPTGNLPIELLRVLCATLAGHTRTAASCWFCLWSGYGWLHGSPAVTTVTFDLVGSGGRDGDSQPAPPALPSDVQHRPRVRLPKREYLLFEGPLEAATELGWNMPGGGFLPQSPNLLWPSDHVWCVASEIDLHCTLVASSESLAEALLADSRLEAWRVQSGDPIN